MSYQKEVQEKLHLIQNKQAATILAIESSCDETAAAVVQNGRELVSSLLFSQIDLHKAYGGVVPEIASRSHVEKIGLITKQALQEAQMDLSQIDAIAVTAGPGLIGCLLVGLSYAKGLSLARRLPLVPVHHIRGHICANLIAHPDLQAPFLCLVVSGGHSHLVAVEDDMSMRVLGRTVDDAAGEAFDKAARALGLPYPGGPELEKLAQNGDKEAFRFPSAFNDDKDHLNFSFSGLKTSIVNQMHNAAQKNEPLNKADLAASFQARLIQILTDKALLACQQYGYQTLALAGGVASNQSLRKHMQDKAETAGLRFVCPPKELCTDNAAMIGSAAYAQLLKGQIADLSLNGRASWRIEDAI